MIMIIMLISIVDDDVTIDVDVDNIDVFDVDIAVNEVDVSMMLENVNESATLHVYTRKKTCIRTIFRLRSIV